MPYTQAVPATNRLLAALPEKDRQRLLASCETVELGVADVLGNPGDPISHVYFPTGSVISLVLPVDGSTGLEVALIGNEGMLGITLILGVDIAPFQALTQGAGPALRTTAQSFLSEFEQNPALQRALKRYLYVLLVQLAQTTACAGFHLVEARLAHQLLTARDRAQSDTLHVTPTSLWPIGWVYGAWASPKRQIRCRSKNSSVTAAGTSRFSTASAWNPLLAGVIGPGKKSTSAYWVRWRLTAPGFRSPPPSPA